MTPLPMHRRSATGRMRALAVFVTVLMALGPFVPIASASNWFLHPPSSTPPSQPQSGQGYVERSVLVAKLVPEDSPSGLTMSPGAMVQSGLSFMSWAVSALEYLSGALLGVFSGAASTIIGIVSGAVILHHSNASPSNASPELATTLSQPSSSGGIPPNDTAGYVENTLLLYNNTLLPGNAPGPFGGAVTPTSITVDPSNGIIFVSAVVDGSNTTVFEVNPSTDRVVKSVTVLPPADTQCGLYAPASTFDTKNGYLYITSSSCPAPVVAVLDTENGTMLKQVQLPDGFGANAIAYDPSSNEIYVTGQYGATESVEIINATNDSLTAPLSLGGCWTFAPLFDSNDGLMYVTVWYCGSNVALRHEDMYAINSTNAVVARIPIPNDDVSVVGADTAGIVPNGTIYEEGGSSGYGRITYPVDVVNPQANTSSVIDIPCGLTYESNTCYPVGVTYDHANGYVYFASSLGSPFVSWNVTAFDPSSGAIAGSIAMGFEGGTTSFALSSGGLQGLSFDPANGQLYGPNPGSGTVSVIFDKRFNVTFAESGLPTGDQWGMVSAGASPKFTTGTTITYSAPNG
ncbi:MAG: hypothetical protein JRN51_08140, partial [Nitrososphaerota archaeon]|nr:hypothetical protein [Nitrososphaerota archaeon]